MSFDYDHGGKQARHFSQCVKPALKSNFCGKFIIQNESLLSYGLFRNDNSDNWSAGLLSWVPESTINLLNGVFEYSSIELTGVYETTIACNNGTDLCYCHFHGDQPKLTFYVDSSTDLQVTSLKEVFLGV